VLRPSNNRGATATIGPTGPPQAQLLQPWRYRQAVEGPQAGPFAPDDFRLIYRKRQIGPAPEQGFQRAPAFDARELMAEAEMDPGTEGDVAVRCPFRPHPEELANGSAQARPDDKLRKPLEGWATRRLAAILRDAAKTPLLIRMRSASVAQ
jgi:hypothetical protein